MKKNLLHRSLSRGVTSGGSSSGSYTVNLNGQWELTTAISNPDSSLYDGVYRSTSNYNVGNGVATMYITIKDCSSFKMYIRSYAESNFDYVMVSLLDTIITGSSFYSDTTLVKAHTRSNQQSGTAISNYTLVEFTGISSGEHTITVVYRKDSSVNRGDDRGYVLIDKSSVNGGDEGGSNEGPIDITNYLTIEALEDGLTASLSVNACEYCVDGDGNWYTITASTSTESINMGQTLSFRGNLQPNGASGIGTFTISKKCNLIGNCMSMLFGNDAANNTSLDSTTYTFCKLFEYCRNIVTVSSNFLPATTLAYCCYSEMFLGCEKLTEAPALPATTLAQDCYMNMFSSCGSLVNAPALPATTLAEDCYLYMFQNCTSLVNAPALPATTLAPYCYTYMFQNCTSLVNAPALPATTLAQDCYMNMFSSCGSLVNAPALPATTLAKKCYASMFRNCTSLEDAPALPATTLERRCYEHMFSNCTSLINAPALPATTFAHLCYDSMFYNTNVLPDCSNIDFTSSKVIQTGVLGGLFAGTKVTDNDLFNLLPINSNGKYYLPVTKLTTNCYESMFFGCTSLTTAPELPATTLVNYCYYNMFYNCSKLNYIKMLATNISAYNCLSAWVSGVASTGTFVKHTNMTSLPTNSSGIPSGWTVLDATS